MSSGFETLSERTVSDGEDTLETKDYDIPQSMGEFKNLKKYEAEQKKLQQRLKSQKHIVDFSTPEAQLRLAQYEALVKKVYSNS